MKFSGIIGFTWAEERLIDGEPSGVFDTVTEEHFYRGDMLNLNYGFQKNTQVNDDAKVSQRISFVADTFAFSHFPSIRYVVWMDNKWEVTNVEVQYPRLTLSIGGIYNG